ncbi:hypothetical protein Droror1_Dr00009382 [Drosera rotundifolia]
MRDDREDSPDWLRNFQVPSHSPRYLSLDSDSSHEEHVVSDESTGVQGNATIVAEDEEEEEVLSKTAAKSASFKRSARVSPKRRQEVEDQTPNKRRKTSTDKKAENDRGAKAAEKSSDKKALSKQAKTQLVWTLSSDSESDSGMRVKDQKEEVEDVSVHKSFEYLVEEKNDEDLQNSSGKHIPTTVTAAGKSPNKRLKQADRLPLEKKNVKKQQGKEEKIVRNDVKGEEEVDDKGIEGEGKSEKHVEHHVSSALPLMLPEKVNRFKALVECEGESIDLSGDVGAVGRVILSDTPSRGHEMLLDLKGTIYKTTIVPSRTFCVVSVGQSEAKIEAIMNDFIQLTPQSNVYDAETMVEGTLDGFSFDSDDEADKIPKATTDLGDQNEGTEEQTDKKTKRIAEKKSGHGSKKGKHTTTAKQPRKRKPQAVKKGKAKK